MVADMIAMGSLEGVSAAPEGGAALSAIRKLVADGTIQKHETVVLFNTGGALKYLDVLPDWALARQSPSETPRARAVLSRS